MHNLRLFLGLLFATLWFLPACGDECEGHGGAATLCRGSTMMQCQQYGAVPIRTCSPNTCVEVSSSNAECVLPGTTCPTDTLGYQCLGERRVVCLANGMVADEGLCSSDQKQIGWGPYCVENAGGAILACGWKKEKCTTQGEVGCFDGGSAICADNVYQYFQPNDKASQASCISTPVANCWSGKTWCEGDVLKRCDRCVDEQTCGSITIEATCNVASCAPYPRPSWMREPWVKDDTLYGCVLDSTACVGGTGMACVDGMAATCIEAGKAVAGLSCAEVQSFVSDTSNGVTIKYGQFCVQRSAQGDAICALDPAPCTVEGATRCAPSDSTGALLETCRDGVWLNHKSCINRSYGTTICQPTASGAVCQ